MPLDAMARGDGAEGAGATLTRSGHDGAARGVEATQRASGDLGRWYVLAIEAGRERAVLNCREAEGFERRRIVGSSPGTHERRVRPEPYGRPQIYLPTVERVIERRRGKRHVSRWPLLPGYLFAQLDLDRPTARRLIDAPHVLGLVRGAGCIVAVSDRQMAQVRALETEAGVIPARVAMGWKIGRAVRINDGPFTGFEGPVRFVRRGGQPDEEIMVDIMIFGRISPIPFKGKQLSEAQEWRP